MIKRLYVHNFRTLLNFSIEFEKMNLLMGSNGVGKSTIFDVLYRLKLFLSGENFRLQDIFSYEDFPKWEKKSNHKQVFEVRIEDELAGAFEYKLTIEHLAKERKNRIGFEELLHEGKPLYRYNSANGGHAQLYRDDYSQGPDCLFDWSRSGISVLEERPYNTKLVKFRELFKSLFVLKINLPAISSEAPFEEEMPKQDLQNFASWYRYLSQANQSQIFELTIRLRQILPGFDSMNLQPAGESKLLNVHFINEGGEIDSYRFTQLSDGQKTLIILYTLLYCLPKRDVILCIDEPENYLALPEVQFWLDALDEQVQEGYKQAVLISHHPRLINLLAANAGQWLYREGASTPTRIKQISFEEQDGLPVSKLIEMGWIVDE